MMIENTSPGQIFTFYSYKGGTGRSMALANVACLLAQKYVENQKVLMIDWDLEAPGLHRFFDSVGASPAQLGLIDLFLKMKELCDIKPFDIDNADDFFENLDLENFIQKTDIENLSLMPAGKFDDLYSTRVNTFNWEDLFNSNPRLISGFANYLAKKFKYVLIDSRTGYTDISNVCAALMPEKLIVVFTPNRQSLDGALGMVKNVTEYRRRSEDLRPLVIFPLPSRIENAESELQKDWRFGSAKRKINGYQTQFERLFQEIYDSPSLSLDEYFDDIQVQYVPRYSYGEDIAVLLDRSEDRLSISRSYENFAEALVLLESPWEYKIKSTINISGTNNSNIYIGGDVNIIFDDKTKILEKNRLRVFLSYARSDKPAVRDLYRRLASVKWIEPWLDEENLIPGQDWSMEIRNAIESAHAVIICLSKNSVTKEGYIQKELQFTLEVALERPEGKNFILPLRLDDCEIPHRIRMWQYADYFPKERRDKTFEKLLKSLLIRKESLK